MKKTLSVILCCLLLVAAFAGCATPAAEPTAPAAPVDPAAAADPAAPADGDMALTEPVTLIYASQGLGTTDNIEAGIYTSIIQECMPAGSQVNVETISAGNSVNGYLIEAGTCDIARCQNAFAATTGIDREPIKDVRALFASYITSINVQILSEQFVKKTGYSGVEEAVAAKYPLRIATESIGSTGEMCCRAFLGALGVTYDDIKSWGGDVILTDGANIVDMLKENRIDLTIDQTSPMNSNYTELAMTSNVVYASFSEELMDKMVERGFSRSVIPKDTYGRFAEETPTVCIATSICVHKDMDEKLAYNITKALWENRDKLAEQIKGWENWNMEIATDTTKTVVDLHPGAIKYWTEQGGM